MPSGAKQHVDPYRKQAIRRDLLRFALPGPVYVPFVGDGDLAVECYADRELFAADIDSARTSVAAARLTHAIIRTVDCDGPFPFADLDDAEPFAVADFDSYVHPYAAFKSFWETAPKADRLVLFFTDGHRQGIKRSRALITPDGEHRTITGEEARRLYNFYWAQEILPWVTHYVEPWTIQRQVHYLRQDMCYFGLVVDKPGYDGEATEPNRRKRSVKFDDIKRDAYLQFLREGESRAVAARKVDVTPTTVQKVAAANVSFSEAQSLAEVEAVGAIENALFTAAKSGNVTAIQVYLYNRAPSRWADKRQPDGGAATPDGTTVRRIVIEEVSYGTGAHETGVLDEAGGYASLQIPSGPNADLPEN